jgi:hypothetical protein
VQGADEEKHTRGNESDALQDTQRARLHQHVILHVQSISDSTETTDGAKEVVGTERPAQGIHQGLHFSEFLHLHYRFYPQLAKTFAKKNPGNRGFFRHG